MYYKKNRSRGFLPCILFGMCVTGTVTNNNAGVCTERQYCHHSFDLICDVSSCKLDIFYYWYNNTNTFFLWPARNTEIKKRKQRTNLFLFVCWFHSLNVRPNKIFTIPFGFCAVFFFLAEHGNAQTIVSDNRQSFIYSRSLFTSHSFCFDIISFSYLFG